MKVGLFCAASSTMDKVYLDAAAEFGKWLAETGNVLIYGGSDCGLMGAVSRACHDNGGRIIGVVPKILYKLNRVSDINDVVIPCEDLNDRKQLMIDQADKIVAMPGSLGTLDEAFTVISANSLGIHQKKVIFYNVNHFWDELFVLFDALERKGAAHASLEDAIDVANNFEELKQLLSVD